MDDYNRFNISDQPFPSSSKEKINDKYEWPEVVGKEGFVAEEVIKSDNDELQT